MKLMKSEIGFLVRISRPILYFFPLITFSFGLALSGANISALAVLEFLMLSFPFNFFLYGINDIFDYESDVLNPRKGRNEGVILKPQWHKRVKTLSFVMAALLVLTAVATMNFINILSMILLLLASYTYSAPPFRIKEKPPFDSISNLFIYFLMPFILGFSLGKPISEIPWQEYLLSLSVIGGHAFTTIADYTPDKKAGIKTFSIVFGKKAAVIFSSLCQLIPAVVIGLTVHNKKALVALLFLVVASLLFLTELFSLNEKHALIIAKIVVACFIFSAIAFFLV